MNEKLEFVDLARDSLHSLYMPVEINNTKLEMLIDTGSPVTLLAENIIESLGVGLSDLSKVESTLSAADGNKMSIKGQIKVNLKIDQSQYRQNTIVTKLGKLKGIIGMDFLQNNKCDLKLSEAKLVIGQQTVKLRKHNNSTCARVKLWPDGKLGQTGIVKHTINTGTAKPVKVPPRRIPTALKPVVEKELDSMLRKGVI
ncbi:unnamed protein product [Mytilus edulis]|uniref:Peptidase A2 domain-containing protein n=1 Tax=Mytilus edulis TaxID=6550 RepID=A0A8S3RXK5_MYTED|nr:unnamed protein product [Mytilus edulis]